MAGAADDPYAVLGVARSAAQAEIKAAYQTLVGKYHPDLHQQNPLEDLAKERMVEINGAYELLSDPARRAAYDAGFRSWTPGRGARQRHAQAAAEGGTVKRAGLTILTIAALPLIFWTAILLVRLLRLLFVRLFGAAGAMGGGRVAAAVVIAGIVVLVVVWRKRRARGGAAPPPPAP
jgi:curved DNA-binding protein CbpA